MTKKLLIKRLNGITREMRVDVLIIEFHQNNSLYARSPDPLSLSIGGVARDTMTLLDENNYHTPNKQIFPLIFIHSN